MSPKCLCRRARTGSRRPRQMRDWAVGLARRTYSFRAARYRSASMAAAQPIPAAVTA